MASGQVVRRWSGEVHKWPGGQERFTSGQVVRIGSLIRRPGESSTLGRARQQISQSTTSVGLWTFFLVPSRFFLKGEIT